MTAICAQRVTLAKTEAAPQVHLIVVPVTATPAHKIASSPQTSLVSRRRVVPPPLLLIPI